MSETFPLKSGDTSTVAQLSLCAGGLVRTWQTALSCGQYLTTRTCDR